MKTWGYIKAAALAKLDLSTDDEDNQVSTFVSRFYIYANEVITQVSSLYKPKYSYFIVGVFSDDKERWKYYANKYSILGYDPQPDVIPAQTPPADNSQEYLTAYNEFWYFYENAKPGFEITFPKDFVSFGGDANYYTKGCSGTVNLDQLNDSMYIYYGAKSFVPFANGEYSMSYNARWFDFSETIDENTELDIPDDILDCIPSYIASQCYKVDDEIKAQLYRNEYELQLSRINDTHYFTLQDMHIKDNW